MAVRSPSTVRAPWGFGDAGRTAEVAGPAKVRQFLEPFLFTRRGERVNRPGYGVGLQDLCHEPIDAAAANLKAALEQGLREEFGDLIALVKPDPITVTVEAATVRVAVVYRPLHGGGDLPVTAVVEAERPPPHGEVP